jgi:hypothetical protein
VLLQGTESEGVADAMIGAQSGFVFAIVVVRAQAIVDYFALIDDGFVPIWQLHVGLLLPG